MRGSADLLLLLAGSLLLFSCTESGLPLGDGGLDSEPAYGLDLGEGSDLPVLPPPPSICDRACLTEDMSLCVRLPGEDRCVECLDDSHCLGNPGALGSKCDAERNYCICDNDQECEGNQRGAHCDEYNQICVCQSDQECHPALPVCVGTEVKTCRPACQADQDCGGFPHCDLATGRCLACLADLDCQQNLLNRHCDQSSGACVACTEDNHCKLGSPFCSQGSCVECSKTEHCALSPKGAQCDKGRCVCSAPDHCQASSAWGARCLTQLAVWRCGCSSSADCAGKAAGPTCNESFQWCTCADDADCQLAPSTTCIYPSDNADYRQCQPPCGNDADCQQRAHNGVNAGLKKCAGGRCVACAVDADCSNDAARPYCNPDQGRCQACAKDSHCGGLTPVCDADGGSCIECRETADCLSHPNGPLCQNRRCSCAGDSDCSGSATWGTICYTVGADRRCGCAVDPDCAGKKPGPHCVPGYQKCSCQADAECALIPAAVCALPYANASYQFCQEPCQSAADCAFLSGLSQCTPAGKCVACLKDGDCGGAKPYCNTLMGQCVGCRGPADCAKEDWARSCDPASGCVECLLDSDCTPSSLGSYCNKGLCICTAAGDCAGNLQGKICDAGVRACSCQIDADCPLPRHCTGSFFGVKICE